MPVARFEGLDFYFVQKLLNLGASFGSVHHIVQVAHVNQRRLCFLDRCEECGLELAL